MQRWIVIALALVTLSMSLIFGGCGLLNDSSGDDDDQEPRDAAVTDEGAYYLPHVTLPRNITASKGDFPDRIVVKWIAGTPGPWTITRCIGIDTPCVGNAWYADLPENATEFVDVSPPPNTYAGYRLSMTLTSVNETTSFNSSSDWGYAAGTLAGPTDTTATTDTRSDGIELTMKAPWLWPDLPSKGHCTIMRAPTAQGPWTRLTNWNSDTYTYLDASVPGGVVYYYKTVCHYDPPTMIGGLLLSSDSNVASGRRSLAADGSTSWGFDPLALGGGQEHGFFTKPWQIAVDGAGNVYVAEWGNKRVQKFTSQGVYVTTFGDHFALESFGSRSFVHPVGVAVDASGDIFVADNDADSGGDWSRIVRLSAGGEFETEWNMAGEKRMATVALSDIVVDKDGRIWGSVNGASSIGDVALVIWDRDGNTVAILDGSGPGCSTKIQSACKLQAAVDGGVWAVCQAGSLKKFDSEGRPVSCAEKSWSPMAPHRAFAVLPDGTLYVGDSRDYSEDPLYAEKKMLHRIGDDGQPAASWGQWGSSSEKLFDVTSMTLAVDGSLYLLDGETSNRYGSMVGNKMVVHLQPF